MKSSLGRYGFPLEQRERMLKPNIKDLGFLSSVLLSYNETVCPSHPSGPIHVSPWELDAGETNTNMPTLILLAVL